jgi:hypothetical protein
VPPFAKSRISGMDYWTSPAHRMESRTDMQYVICTRTSHEGGWSLLGLHDWTPEQYGGGTHRGQHQRDPRFHTIRFECYLNL